MERQADVPEDAIDWRLTTWEGALRTISVCRRDQCYLETQSPARSLLFI